MGLETGNYIGDLNVDNPTGADPKSQGDNHLRLIKLAARQCFPGFTGAILVGGTATGVADAYQLTPATPMVAYTKNTMVIWQVPITNVTPTPTIDISTLGPRIIRAVNGTALLANDLPAGQFVAMIDTGTEYRLIGVTKNYVDNLSFSSALPTPPTAPGTYYLIYESGVFSYSTSTTPDYLIQAQGIY